MEPSRKLAASLHVIDRGVCQRHDLSKLGSAYGRSQWYPAGMGSGSRECCRRILKLTNFVRRGMGMRGRYGWSVAAGAAHDRLRKVALASISSLVVH